MPTNFTDEIRKQVVAFAQSLNANFSEDTVKRRLDDLALDIADIAEQMKTATDEPTRAHYEDALRRRVEQEKMQFLSDMNVRQNEAADTAERILVAGVKVVVKAALGPAGALV